MPRRNASVIKSLESVLRPEESLHLLLSSCFKFALSSSQVHDLRYDKSVSECVTVVCVFVGAVVQMLLCRSVLLLVSPAKTAEQIEMPLGLRTRICLGNHVFDEVQIPHVKGQFCVGKGASQCKV